MDAQTTGEYLALPGAGGKRRTQRARPHQHDGVLLRAGLAAPQRERRGAARVGRRPLRLRLPVERLELRAVQPRALWSLRVALVR